MKTIQGLPATLAAAVALTTSAAGSPSVFHDSLTIKARVVTGTNRYLDTPQSDLGPPFGTAGFSNVGAFNAAGREPLPLRSGANASTVLATFVDPAFLSIIGRTPADVPANLLNIPINEVPVNVSPAGDHRIALQNERAASPLEPSRAEPTRAVTLGEWARADGTASIRCGALGNHLSLRLNDLLPNKLYTVWAIVGTPDGLAPLPMGGVPNAVVTDADGRATFARSLRSCPTDPAVSQGRVLLIDIVLHSDNQLYGAVPDLPLAGLYTGAINQTHLEFPIAGQPVQ